MFQSSQPITGSTFEKEKDEKLEKAISLEEP
jgi:hypothetical protein